MECEQNGKCFVCLVSSLSNCGYTPTSIWASTREILLNAYTNNKGAPVYLRSPISTPRAHNVETTSIQRWFNVLTLNQRWIDVVSTLCACWDLCCSLLREQTTMYFSIAEQTGLCLIWSETPKTGFPVLWLVTDQLRAHCMCVWWVGCDYIYRCVLGMWSNLFSLLTSNRIFSV